MYLLYFRFVFLYTIYGPFVAQQFSQWHRVYAALPSAKTNSLDWEERVAPSLVFLRCSSVTLLMTEHNAYGSYGPVIIDDRLRQAVAPTRATEVQA